MAPEEELTPDPEVLAEATGRRDRAIAMLDRFINRMAVSPEHKITRAASMMPKMSGGAGCCIKTLGSEEFSPYELLWSGVFQGLSGYAKASREIVLRLANSFHVGIEHAIKCGGSHTMYDESRYSLHERVPVSPGAPFVRFFGPWNEDGERKAHRINYTMMETELIHPTMIGLMNDNYDECWTPTMWNAEAFAKSGLKLPIRVMPLGVNPWLYRPGKPEPMPEATLLTTGNAGAKEKPYGFVFLYVFLPSFRKGVDILVKAFEDAFGDDPEAALVLAVTHASPATPLVMPSGKYRSRIYSLTGDYDELGMAKLYRGANAYVTTSRGEGWNLPMIEAAACGLPVIAPRASSHPEICDEQAWLFSPDGLDFYQGAEAVSPWYEGMPFPVFGPKSQEQLVHFLRTVRVGGTGVHEKAAALRRRVTSIFTWDRAAARIADRIAELIP
jgi:glycosyltransferase involved in cell wall biosynthesis